MIFPDIVRMPVKSVKPVKRGGSAGGRANRSQVTGRQLGKADLRAQRKNADCVFEYMYAIENSTSASEFAEYTNALNSVIARVVRGLGAGRFEVLLVDGSTERVRVAGSISLRGSAATKTDRDNCMCVGDYILIRAGLASAKLPMCNIDSVRAFYDKHSIAYPQRFFGSEEDGDDLFDYSEERRPVLSSSKSNCGGGDCDEEDDADSVVDDIDVSQI